MKPPVVVAHQRAVAVAVISTSLANLVLPNIAIIGTAKNTLALGDGHRFYTKTSA